MIELMPNEKIVLVDKCQQLEKTDEYLFGLIKIEKIIKTTTIAQEIHIQSKTKIGKVFLNGIELEVKE